MWPGGLRDPSGSAVLLDPPGPGRIDHGVMIGGVAAHAGADVGPNRGIRYLVPIALTSATISAKRKACRPVPELQSCQGGEHLVRQV
jgi:hypothetical protein